MAQWDVCLSMRKQISLALNHGSLEMFVFNWDFNENPHQQQHDSHHTYLFLEPFSCLRLDLHPNVKSIIQPFPSNFENNYLKPGFVGKKTNDDIVFFHFHQLY